MSSPHTTYDFAKHPGVDLLADGSGVIGYTILGTESVDAAAVGNSSFEDWLRDIDAVQCARRCRPGLPAMAGFRGECFLVHKEVLRDWLRGDGSGTACYTCVASADAFPSTAGEEGWFYVTRLELERGVFLRRQWGATQPARVYLVDHTPESRASAVAAGRAWVAEREDKRYQEAMDSLLKATESSTIFSSHDFRNPEYFACGTKELIYHRSYFKELKLFARNAAADRQGLHKLWCKLWCEGVDTRSGCLPRGGAPDDYVIVPERVLSRLFVLIDSEITKRGFVNAQELERQLSARFDANRGHARKALHNAVDKLRVLSDNVPASNRQPVYRNQIKELMQQLADISTHVLNMDPFRA